jgi:hypothetical protein
LTPLEEVLGGWLRGLAGKAWFASFPPDLWPAKQKEEETSD